MPLRRLAETVSAMVNQMDALPGYQEILHQLKLAIQILEEAGVWPENIPDIQDIL